MNSHSNFAAPGIHWHGGPLVAFKVGPVSERTCPVVASATQSASPESRVCTNAIVRLSGDQLTNDKAAGVGTAMRPLRAVGHALEYERGDRPRKLWPGRPPD